MLLILSGKSFSLTNETMLCCGEIVAMRISWQTKSAVSGAKIHLAEVQHFPDEYGGKNKKKNDSFILDHS